VTGISISSSASHCSSSCSPSSWNGCVCLLISSFVWYAAEGQGKDGPGAIVYVPVMQKEQSPHQRRSQLKTNPVAPSIKYKGIYTIVVKIYGNFDVDISIFFSFTVVRMHQEWKANVVSPLLLTVVSAHCFVLAAVGGFYQIQFHSNNAWSYFWSILYSPREWEWARESVYIISSALINYRLSYV